MRSAAIAALLSLTLTACAKRDEVPPPAAPAPASSPALGPGEAAPAYAAHALDDGPASLEALRGRVVLLNVWATWCKPCRAEMPALQRLQVEYGERGFDVIGVSIDAGDSADITGFAHSVGATYRLWHDPDNAVSNVFRTVGVPSTYLIDRAGVLRWQHVGVVDAVDAELRAVIEEALHASGQ